MKLVLFLKCCIFILNCPNRTARQDSFISQNGYNFFKAVRQSHFMFLYLLEYIHNQKGQHLQYSHTIFCLFLISQAAFLKLHTLTLTEFINTAIMMSQNIIQNSRVCSVMLDSQKMKHQNTFTFMKSVKEIIILTLKISLVLYI